MALILKSAKLESVPVLELKSIDPSQMDRIKQNCHHSKCRINAGAVTHFIKNSEYIEGIVVLENGFCYEHCWNKIGENHFDVSIELIGTEEEKSTKKNYYPVHTFPNNFSEHNSPFSKEVKLYIEEYYDIISTHKQNYDKLSEDLKLE